MDEQPDSGRPSPRIKLLGREIALPQSRAPRIALGLGLVMMGSVGFLPVLGFWMIPLGLFVLAHDSPAVRRFNRRSGVWLRRKFQKKG
ncbi:MAG: hypothetical protein ABIK36_00125 [Pseudomonadota bacterium]